MNLSKPQKKRVLVVDDNKDITDSMLKIFGILGYEARGALDGNKAIKQAREFRPDAVILDIGLPDISGYEVAKTLRKEIPWPFKLIAVSGYGQKEDKEKARLAGFDHHFTKPVSIQEIEKVI